MTKKVRNRTIFNSRKFTINLVTYPVNYVVIKHLDLVQRGRYYKLNFVLIKPKVGGIFECSNCIMNIFDRIFLFRPDQFEHGVSKIISGKRVLLSFALNI